MEFDIHLVFFKPPAQIKTFFQLETEKLIVIYHPIYSGR